MPGQLKNSLDWASRPFPDNVLRGKPVAVDGALADPDLRAALGKVVGRLLDEARTRTEVCV